MKPLDEYIRSNPGRFDTEEPPEGHFERFEERISGLRRKGIAGSFNMALKIAAAVLLGLVITYSAIREFDLLKNGTQGIYSVTEDTELNEAEQFYTRQLNLAYAKIQNLQFKNDPDEKSQVLRELSDMDQQVRAMKQDLKQNPDDERIVHAIIFYYQLKIEMMDLIISRTQQTSSTIL